MKDDGVMTVAIEEVTFESERFRMRPMRPADAELVQQYVSDPEVALTYVAATIQAVLTLLYYLWRSGLLGRR